jgi:CubicO group peptidase (beta-lactamase class C family)
VAFAGDLQGRLDEAVVKYRTPGAAVAVGQGGELATAASGVLNRNTGQPATPDSVFQVGSITKVWTATLVLQLVDDGLVDLDDPVRRHLPDFAVVDEQASRTVTIRQLLCHTGGFFGDLFDDFGAGEDALDRYVANLATAATQTLPVGARFSYCNSGYCVLGKLVRELRGAASWEQVVRDRLFGPLGTTRVALRPEEAILLGAAVGHNKTADSDELSVVGRWMLPQGTGPAGATLCASPAELVTFGRMFLAGGAAADGTRVLAPDTVAAMRTPQVTVPGVGARSANAWGLGFQLFDWAGTAVIGHDGGTIGQGALWRVIPEHDLVVALAVNGGTLGGLFDDVLVPTLAELTGIELPPRPAPPEQPVEDDLTAYAGRYTAGPNGHSEVAVAGDGLDITDVPSESAQALGDYRNTEHYAALGNGAFLLAKPGDGEFGTVLFPEGGAYLFNSRVNPRMS